MASKKYQVFISSTYMDLKEERNDISRAILNLDHIPAGMELFPGIDEEQFSFIQKVINDCDYYVLILGGRYGSLSPEGLGFTEMEYDYAIEKGLRVIRLVHNSTGSISVDKSETNPELVEKLAAFRKKVSTSRLVKFWHDRPTLQAAFYESFSQTISHYPATGWVRGDSVDNHDLLLQLNGVRTENEKLKSELVDLSGRSVKIPDLASLNTEFSFTISHSNGAAFGHQSVSMLWQHIFQHVAAELRGSRPRDSLNVAVARNIIGGSRYPVSGDPRIDDLSWERILIQLTAAGLIWTDDRRRYELTEPGLTLYTESTVIRSSSNQEE